MISPRRRCADRARRSAAARARRRRRTPPSPRRGGTGCRPAPSATSSLSPDDDADLDAVGIAERPGAAGGSAKSMMTLTRCSSTPSAETFMNPEGSTRRTRAVERLAAAPLLDAGTGAPAARGRRRSTADRRRPRAVAGRRSRAAARRPAPPTRSRAAASAPRRRPARRRRRRGPAGGRRLQAGARAAAARTRRARRRTPRRAAPLPRSSARSPRASSSSRGDGAGLGQLLLARAATICARSSAAAARSRSARAWPTAARAASTAAVSSARVRASSSGGAPAGASAHDRLAANHAIAGLELDPLQPARHRRRDDEALAHARLAVFVDRDLHRRRAPPCATSTSIGSGHIADGARCRHDHEHRADDPRDSSAASHA